MLGVSELRGEERMELDRVKVPRCRSPQCVSLPSPARLVGIDDVWRAVGAYSRGVPVRGGLL